MLLTAVRGIRDLSLPRAFPRVNTAVCFVGLYTVKANFHCAILVADRSEAGRRSDADFLARASSLLMIGQIPARCRSATSFGPFCDKDSVIEFGLKPNDYHDWLKQWVKAKFHYAI